MSPPTRTRSVVTTIACVTALSAFGCNALLDNRPADINGDLFATEPAGEADSAPGAGRDVDASVPDPGDPGRGADPGAGGADSAATPGAADAAADADAAPPQCGPCAPPHAAGACVGGQCLLGACAAGWADCNHLATDGCETDLSSPASCGACGAACMDGPHASPTCAAGACALQCDPGFGNCNLRPDDGCEAQLMKDKHNCGACGQICIVGTCESGTCVWKP